MTRWTYYLPRVVLAVILLTVATLGVAPAIRWSLTNGIESSLGSELTVETVAADLTQGVVQLRQVAVMDNDRPGSNLVEIDRAILKFDPWELARRRLVIPEGELCGVRINADTGIADCTREVAQAQRTSAASNFGKTWRQSLSQPRVSPAQLKGIQLARQIKEQRLRDFEAITRQSDNWQADFDELDRLTSEVGDNPLRMTPEYRARLEELAQVGDNIQQLDVQLESLRRQIQEDRIQLVSLQEADVAMMQGDAKLDQISGDQLSDYLLEDEWAARIGAWVNWVRATRQLSRFHPTRDRFAWTNSRGVDVVFNAGRRADFVADNLYLQGTGQVNGMPFRFRGTLNNVSNEPGLASKPTVLTLAAEGQGQIQMDAVIDRSQPTPLDRIRVLCPAMPTPQKTWGDPTAFAVEAEAGVMYLTLMLELRGDELAGQVEFSHADTKLVPRWPGADLNPSQQDTDMPNQAVQTALRDLREVSGCITLSGTLDHPVWEMQSDLGRHVASRMKQVLEQQLQTRNAELVAEYQRLANQELEELVTVLEQQERTTAERLAAKSAELERFRSRISQRADLMDRLVRNAGPLENLLR